MVSGGLMRGFGGGCGAGRRLPPEAVPLQTEVNTLIASESTPSSAYKKAAGATVIRTADSSAYTIPEAATSFRLPTQTDKGTATLSIDHVHKVVSKYQGTQVTEKGSGLTRRIWVINPKGWAALENELKKMGFQWAASRQAWYWAED